MPPDPYSDYGFQLMTKQSGARNYSDVTGAFVRNEGGTGYQRAIKLLVDGFVKAPGTYIVRWTGPDIDMRIIKVTEPTHPKFEYEEV